MVLHCSPILNRGTVGEREFAHVPVVSDPTVRAAVTTRYKPHETHGTVGAGGVPRCKSRVKAKLGLTCRETPSIDLATHRAVQTVPLSQEVLARIIIAAASTIHLDFASAGATAPTREMVCAHLAPRRYEGPTVDLRVGRSRVRFQMHWGFSS